MIDSKLKSSLAVYCLALVLSGCTEDSGPQLAPPPMAAGGDAAIGTDRPGVETDSPAMDAGPESSSGAAGRSDTPSRMGADTAPAPQMDAGPEPREPTPDAAPEPPEQASPMPEPMATTDMPKPPEWPEDCETRHAFLAHGKEAVGDTSKFAVPGGSQYYRVFYFARPWSADVQVLMARSIVDNSKVVHHWTLYTVDDDAVDDGEIRGGGNGTFDAPSLGASIGIYSAGPGASDLVMPTGIGLRVPATPRLALEVHYFNASDSMEEDRTGVEVCITSKKRPIEAASHQLGKVEFAVPAHRRTDVTSVCRPRMQREDIHLMTVTPHMHLAGRHFKLTLNRASGDAVTLFDKPYAFEEQRSYALPLDASAPDVVMKPGDTLASVCTFENAGETTIVAGTRTEDEMCQPLVVAWPAGALNNGLLPTALVAASAVGCVEL